MGVERRISTHQLLFNFPVLWIVKLDIVNSCGCLSWKVFHWLEVGVIVLLVPVLEPSSPIYLLLLEGIEYRKQLQVRAQWLKVAANGLRMQSGHAQVTSVSNTLVFDCTQYPKYSTVYSTHSACGVGMMLW